jgi:hypothetical protein
MKKPRHESNPKKIDGIVVVQKGIPRLLDSFIPLVETSELPNPANLENGIAYLDITENQLLISLNGSWFVLPSGSTPPPGPSDSDNRFFRMSSSAINSVAEDEDFYYLAGGFNAIYPEVSAGLGAINLSTDEITKEVKGIGFNANVGNCYFKDNYAYVPFAGSSQTKEGIPRYDGEIVHNFAKINLDTLELDSTFHTSVSGFPQIPNTVLTSASGLLHIGVGASSTTYNGTTVTGWLISVNENDGTLFTAPSLGRFAGGPPVAAVVNSGHLVAVGNFTSYDGVTASGIARINLSTGLLDPTFGTGHRFTGGNPTCIVLDSGTGHYYVGGTFSTYSGTATPSALIKLDALTGNRELSYSVTASNLAGAGILSMMLDGNSLYIGGGFATVSGFNYHGIARIHKSTGILDTTFNTLNKMPAGTGYSILNIDANLIAVSASATKYQNSPVGGPIFINKSDGSLNKVAWPGLYTGLGGSQYQHRLGLYNNKVYVSCGSARTVGGEQHEGIVKLDKTTFNIDPNFISYSGTLGFSPSTINRTERISVDDTYVYRTGTFTTYSGINKRGLVKLDKNTGSIAAFPETSSATSVVADQYLTDTYLYLCGSSNLTFSGVPTNYLYRIHLASGTVDTSFSGFTGGSTNLSAVAVHSGAVYVAGTMSSYRGTPVSGKLTKIDETTGNLDLTFNTNVSISGGFNSNNIRTLLAESGSLYVGGAFTSFAGSAIDGNRLVKLNTTTGLKDALFHTGSGFDSTITNMYIENDILYPCGGFVTYSGVPNLFTSVAKLDKVTGEAIPGFNTSSLQPTSGPGNLTTMSLMFTNSGSIIGVGFQRILTPSGYPIGHSYLIDKTTGDLLR